jgi:hypothetical protein
MYNSDTPARADLPSSRQLLRSTLLAAVSAAVLLVAVVLPAEYGVDPTGIGRVLRLTEMGTIKQQLAAESAVDAAAAPAATAAPSAPAAPAAPAQAGGATAGMASADAPRPAAAPAAAASPQVAWRDEMPFTLTPGEGTEIKLKMVEGGKAQFAWVVEGGTVNFDTHGDAKGKSISYEKGRSVAADEGVLEAAFTGNHGWYWRNRGKANVKVTLRTRGDYTDIQRMK